MVLPLELRGDLEERLGDGVCRCVEVSGGCISSACVLEFEGGGKYFLKFLRDAPVGFFEAEALGLRELRAADALLAPEVRGVGSVEGLSWILMELLEQGVNDVDAQESFGRGLAALHSYRGLAYGFSADNFIGLTPQYNRSESREARVGEESLSWAEFFLKYRLEPQARFGEEKGWFAASLAKAFQRLETTFLSILSEHSEPPSLLHGDLWSGNIFWSAEGPAIIDPAVYYGSREADLAFMQLFSSPPPTVLGAYQEVLPVAEGFERRKEVLNLYHLMNHANLFGGSYVQEVKATLRSLGN